MRRIWYVLVGLLLGLAPAAVPCAAELQPNFLLAAGLADKPTYVIVVEKDLQQLSLWRSAAKVTQLLRLPCSTGENRGRKRVSGDRKTPEGVYFFTHHFKAAVLAARYGTRAFPLDYPNCFDRRAGRGGYSIWLHGTNRPLKKRNSNGCIVLANADIDRLAEYIVLERTPLVIVKRIHYNPTLMRNRQARMLLTFLEYWNIALTCSPAGSFRELYDRACASGLNWLPAWEALDKRLVAAGVSFYTSFEAPVIYHYGMDYVIEFVQYLTMNGKNRRVGRRRMYVAQNGADFRVLEDRFLRRAGKDSVKADDPLVKLAREGLHRVRPAAGTCAWSKPPAAAYPEAACRGVAYFEQNSGKHHHYR